MAKKDNQKIVTKDELTKLIKIILIVCVVLVAFYFLTVLVTKNKDNDKIEDTAAVIQYQKIIVGEILNRAESEYLVLVQKEDDVYIDLYNQYLQIYSGKKGSLNYYTVVLDEVFNQNNISEETDVLGNDVQNYKFANTTLIKVKNGTLESVYKDKDSIISYLNSLIK